MPFCLLPSSTPSSLSCLQECPADESTVLMTGAGSCMWVVCCEGQPGRVEEFRCGGRAGMPRGTCRPTCSHGPQTEEAHWIQEPQGLGDHFLLGKWARSRGTEAYFIHTMKAASFLWLSPTLFRATHESGNAGVWSPCSLSWWQSSGTTHSSGEPGGNTT